MNVSSWGTHSQTHIHIPVIPPVWGKGFRFIYSVHDGRSSLYAKSQGYPHSMQLWADTSCLPVLSQYPISGMINSIRYILHLIWLDMSGFDFWNIMILTTSEYRNCHHHPWGCQQHLSVQWPFGYMALLRTEQNGKGQRIGIETVQRWEL